MVDCILFKTVRAVLKAEDATFSTPFNNGLGRRSTVGTWSLFPAKNKQNAIKIFLKKYWIYYYLNNYYLSMVDHAPLG